MSGSMITHSIRLSRSAASSTAAASRTCQPRARMLHSSPVAAKSVTEKVSEIADKVRVFILLFFGVRKVVGRVCLADDGCAMTGQHVCRTRVGRRY